MLGSVCLFRVEKRLARRAWLGAPTSFTWDTCWELVSSFNARLRRTSQLIDGPLSSLLALWLDRWQGGRLCISSFLFLLFSLPGILVWMGAQGGALYKFSVYIYLVSTDFADFVSPLWLYPDVRQQLSAKD